MKKECIRGHSLLVAGAKNNSRECRLCARIRHNNYAKTVAGKATLHKHYMKNREHYALLNSRNRKANRQRYGKYQAEYQTRTKMFIWSLKMNPCVDCKNWYMPWVMQFDHLPRYSKFKEINAAWNSTDQVLFKEIAKCELVCANCHENRSYVRRFLDAA